MTTTSTAPPAGGRLSLLALMICVFAIGTTEFVIVGILPEVADDIGVSVPTAGLLVTGYALGVAFGGPAVTALTGRLPRKGLLLALMGAFVAANMLAALAPSYGVLLVARVLSALAHGTFFAVATVMASEVVAPERRASAIAQVAIGLNLATVVGVPLGTCWARAPVGVRRSGPLRLSASWGRWASSRWSHGSPAGRPACAPSWQSFAVARSSSRSR